jgi:hypothetical protein
MLCRLCNKPLVKKWSIKFCSHSCAAIYNNSLKNKEVTCYYCNNLFKTQNHIVRKKYRCTNCLSLKIKPVKKQKTKNCKICNEIFLPYKTQVYCSDACRAFRNRKHDKVCQNCDKGYKAEKKDSKFCSHSCRSKSLKLHIYAHKKSGLSRSKIEEYIENQLLNDFSNVNFIFNDKTTIGSELDIYIPQLKLAFELNGIFHYIPVYGENTLNRIQNRDKQKAILCFEQGIELVTINLGNSGFTKKFAKNIYSQIYQLVNKNINRINCAV